MVSDSQFAELEEMTRAGCINEAAERARALLPAAGSEEQRAALLARICSNNCRLGRAEDARAALEELKATRTTDPLYSLIAEFYEAAFGIATGDHRAAAANLASMLDRRRAVLQEERYRWLLAEIERRLAGALVSLSRWAEAIPILRELLGLEAVEEFDRQRVHYDLAVCLRGMGDLETASGEFERVAAYGLTNDLEEASLYALAAIAYQRGDYPAAKVKLEKILKDYPGPVSFVERDYVFEYLRRIHTRLGAGGTA